MPHHHRPISSSHPMCGALVLLLICAVANPAHAHTEAGVAGGLSSGFLHPMLGLDHLVAMVAVGLWGAQLGKPAIWLLPITFPMVMAAGGVMGLAGPPLPAIEGLFGKPTVVNNVLTLASVSSILADGGAE